MPNYCYNTLKVSGPDTALKQFDTQFKEGGLDLIVDHKLPLTKDQVDKINKKDYLIYQISERDDVYSFKGLKSINPLSSYSFSAFIPPDLNSFERGWYDWRIENWGTKWDVDIESPEKAAGSSSYQFSTAWSPPTPVIECMIKTYPDLIFRLTYVEEGPSYAGIMEGFEGSVTLDKYVQDNVNEFLMNELGYVFYACPNCGELISEDFIDNEECYSCECEFEYDSSSNKLVKKEETETTVANEIEENKDEETDVENVNEKTDAAEEIAATV